MPMMRGGSPPPSLMEMAAGTGGGAAGGGQPQQYGTGSLLNMLSGAAGGMGGDGGRGGGGGGGLSGPFGGAGGLSPEDKARYFDASGGFKIDDPRQVAAESGMNLGQLWGGFLPRSGAGGIEYSSGGDQGGFFTAEDMSRAIGRPVPGIATHQANAPSTNNWRLLGMGPGWIMRNGELINTRASEVGRGGFSGADMGVGRTAEEGMAALSGSYLGSGAGRGTPNRWNDNFYWPGAATGGYTDRYPTFTNV